MRLFRTPFRTCWVFSYRVGNPNFEWCEISVLTLHWIIDKLFFWDKSKNKGNYNPPLLFLAPLDVRTLVLVYSPSNYPEQVFEISPHPQSKGGIEEAIFKIVNIWQSRDRNQLIVCKMKVLCFRMVLYCIFKTYIAKNKLLMNNKKQINIRQ